MSKFMRFIAEFEVEVTDITAARAEALTIAGSDGEGVYDLTDEEVVHRIITTRLFQGLDDHPVGVRYIGGSSFPRFAEGDTYAEVTLPELARRRDDGTVPGLDD